MSYLMSSDKSFLLCLIRMLIMKNTMRSTLVKPRNPLVALVMSKDGRGSHTTIKYPSRQKLKRELERELQLASGEL